MQRAWVLALMSFVVKDDIVDTVSPCSQVWLKIPGWQMIRPFYGAGGGMGHGELVWSLCEGLPALGSACHRASGLHLQQPSNPGLSPLAPTAHKCLHSWASFPGSCDQGFPLLPGRLLSPVPMLGRQAGASFLATLFSGGRGRGLWGGLGPLAALLMGGFILPLQHWFVLSL